MKPCPNTPEFCPNGMSCIEKQNDTILEYQRSTESNSHSSNSLIVDFHFGYKIVKSIELDTILGAADFELHRMNLGLVPKWNAIMLTITGTNGAGLSVFRIKEDADIVFDLVEIKGCETVWLDGKPHSSSGGCYGDTVFEQELFNREINLNTSGNFMFEDCGTEREFNLSLMKVSR